MSSVRRCLFIACVWLAVLSFAGAETLPPKPDRYFNDYARVVSSATAQKLDDQLRQFERDTSNQILVAVYPKMESESSIQDYTFRTAESWKAGQKGKDNGAVLFVFTQPRTMFIQVGYGLEGALPDITAKQIIENEIKPAFRAGNFDAGFTAGVDAMIKATRGEYRGTGKTRGSSGGQGSYVPLIFMGLFLLVFIMQMFSSRRRAVVYGRNGRSFTGGLATDLLLSVLSSSGRYRGGDGGGFFGGGGGGDGGGFSGGGGSFGGGGAGGDW